MNKLSIWGPAKLSGSVKISCSKNACLPIIAGTLLTEKKVILESLPNLRDVKTIVQLLSKLGSEIKENASGEWVFDNSHLESVEARYDLVKTMRASILVLGPLLARYGRAVVSLPGGCAIGMRPIDIHLEGLRQLGAKIELEGGYVVASCDDKLKGAEILLSFPSVGATENIMMAAVLAKGKTIIRNAACEPEITDLANFLNRLGGKVSGAGSNEMEIIGVDSLDNEISYNIIPDRIEAATYIIAAVATRSEITVENVVPGHLESVLGVLEQMGASFDRGFDEIKVLKTGKLKGVNIETAPYPGFPTDVQAQLMALASTIDGETVITENIFENRFMHVPELVRMGVAVNLKNYSAYVKGGGKLSGAPVMCTDLRASAALVIAALVADGETQVRRIYHLERGYDDFDKKLRNLDVKIEKYIGEE
ncbi:UDP-N-acetylglucosamine 1-carboxyvinyltransferase [Bacteriovoracaceae bacterium]|nr:UDP-N-acetylglucosamine 1-carboxyvinyltransferase [Bacteriovoracaceae bacterium]